MHYLRLIVVSALATAALVAVASPAQACTPGTYDPATNEYCQSQGGQDADEGSSDQGPSGPPPCDLAAAEAVAAAQDARNPGSPYCEGVNACVNGDHFPPWGVPPGDKPEDGEMKVQYCSIPPGSYRMLPIWSGGNEPPSLAEQAREAVGNIDLGSSKIAISPATRTLVNLDTWYWLDGGMPQTATGSSAFGLVAIATFQGLEVTTGDGTTVTCPYVTSKEQAETECAHTYRRTSGGSPYTVGAVATYGLRFEMNGQAMDNIPGAPDTLDGPVTSSPLQVTEVQTRVTRTR